MAELEKQVLELKRLTPPIIQQNTQSASNSVAKPFQHPTYCHSALSVLRDARRIVGFSPISMDDINCLKEQNPSLNDVTAMTEAIIEFLKCEMKVPKATIDKVEIKRVFPPAKHSENGWTTLYAEFADISTAETITQFVGNLLPGRHVSIYVPHSLYHRFTAINAIAHKYRNGSVKHKTKVKYGHSDFVLLVKPKDSNSSWSYPSLDFLPPLQLQPPDNSTEEVPSLSRPSISTSKTLTKVPENVVNVNDNTREPIDDVTHLN